MPEVCFDEDSDPVMWGVCLCGAGGVAVVSYGAVGWKNACVIEEYYVGVLLMEDLRNKVTVRVVPSAIQLQHF